MVTRSSTSRPFQCLCMAERTKSLSVTLERKSRLLELIPRFSNRSSSYLSKSRESQSWIQDIHLPRKYHNDISHLRLRGFGQSISSLPRNRILDSSSKIQSAWQGCIVAAWSIVSMVIKTDCLQELSVTKLLGVATNAKIDLRHPKACKSEPTALYKQYLIRGPAALDRLLLQNVEFHTRVTRKWLLAAPKKRCFGISRIGRKPERSSRSKGSGRKIL
jgi:hypothetical protein